MSNIIKFEQQKQEIDYFKTLVTIASKSSTYKDMTPEVMLNIMLTAKDLGISPMKALNGGFYIVNGKISMSTALMADRIRRDGHSIRITEWTRDKCVIIGKRRDNEDSVKVEFTMEDAQLAGLTNSPTWKKFPKPMLYNRAMSMLARVLFPDVVGNCYSEDERYDIMDIPPEKRPMEDPDTISVQAISRLEIQEEAPSIERLSQYLKSMMVDPTRLMEFIEERANKVNKTKEQIIGAALLDNEITNKFCAFYSKWLHETAEIDNSESVAV